MVPAKPKEDQNEGGDVLKQSRSLKKKQTHLGHGYSQVLRKSQMQILSDPLQDLRAVYKPHKELFFEDEKDKKQNVLQVSTDLLASTMENNLHLKSSDFPQQIQTIQTREYLREIGIQDEMEKIKLHKDTHQEDPSRRFEKLNVENPINKVRILSL